MKTKIIVFQLEVEVPARTGESEVENAINAALDEPWCDWGNWQVGAAIIKTVTRGQA